MENITKKPEHLRIGDEIAIIVTGDTLQPLCTKANVVEIIGSCAPRFQNAYCIVFIDNRELAFCIKDMFRNEDGNWYYVKNVINEECKKK